MSKIKGAELQPLPPRRAYSIDEFGEVYGPGHTKIYEEIRAGRLRARKLGRRTIITEDDAEEWLRRLPAVPTSEAAT